MKGRRRIVTMLVTLSLAPGVTALEARRELRTRVNEQCCHSREEEDVRVRRVGPGPRRRPVRAVRS